MLVFIKNKLGSFNVLGPEYKVRPGVVFVEHDGKTVRVRIGRISKSFIAKYGQFKGQCCRFGFIDDDIDVNGVIGMRPKDF
jgi:hypothetical protein